MPFGELPLKDKVSQLFIVTPEAVRSAVRAGEGSEINWGITDNPQPGSVALHENKDNLVLDYTPEVARGFAEYPVGGVVLFGRNVVNSEQVSGLLSGFRQEAKLPFFTSIDEEGGRVARIGNAEQIDVPTFPAMAEIGASGDESKAYEVGQQIGGYLKDHGFNLNYAPVADVFTNPDNTVIGTRAFSHDPEIAAKMVASAVSGFRDAGVGIAIKHFPGHGDTGEDSHKQLAVSKKTLAQLHDIELVPFKAGIDAGSDMVMVGHIATPHITDDGLPATLSHTLLTDVLRKQLGFDGVIITDAMNMKAIADNYSSGEAAVKALEAGADIILMPENFADAHQGVMDAVASGRLTEARIDESLARIQKAHSNIESANR
jgi:beta-N-acetylhexosaminidase